MAPETMPIDSGAAVIASDGRLGTVDEVRVQPDSGQLSYLLVRRGWSDEQLVIPADLIDSMPNPREVRLRVTREEAVRQAAGVPADALIQREGGSELRVPVVEERLVAGKRQVDLGELRIHKYVEQIEEAVRQPVTRDDLVVERIPMNQPVDAPVSPRFEGDWLVVPIMKEVLVVEKRLMLVEELRIRKQQVTEEQEIRELVRHERLELEDATVYGVSGLTAPGGAPPHPQPASPGARPGSEVVTP